MLLHLSNAQLSSNIFLSYDDSWAAVKWVVSHFSAGGGEVWLKEYVDFDRVFFAGDSAGGNIAHNMAIRVGSDGLDGVKIVGMVLIHPYFGGKDPIGSEGDGAATDKFWLFVYRSAIGSDDPLFNPVVDPKFSSVVCDKVLVCVVGKDFLKDRGRYYKEELERSGWGGVVEIMEVAGKDHVFHLIKPICENAVAMLKRVACFLNENNA
ncbi:probable carboxylesterase 12 [Camellia sinensis]|uniref:probable carboxylesterase 12 n=1 Tax=Camellia sinensis TaxID=4442 RepID=UPI001035CCF3|nr:probable carboxylesterase 12 [Camellia sinensis]